MTTPRTALERVRDTLMRDDPDAYSAACRDLWRATREAPKPVSLARGDRNVAPH